MRSRASGWEPFIFRDSNPGLRFFRVCLAIPIALDGGLAQFASYTPALANSVSSPNKLPAEGTCIVNTFKGDATNAIPVDPVVAPGLDAGIAIAVTGPKGTKPLKQVTKGYYSASLSENSATNPTGTPFLERGTYTVTNGDGGADVKPFSLTLTLPETDPITWTNKADLASATRGQDLTLKWTTTDPNAVVIISGTSTTPVGTDTIGAGVFLLGTRQRGNFTVPGAILSALLQVRPRPDRSFRRGCCSSAPVWRRISARRTWTWGSSRSSA